MYIYVTSLIIRKEKKDMMKMKKTDIQRSMCKKESRRVEKYSGEI